MVVAVLKMYFIGTALIVLTVLFGMADSIGGLMYVQDRHCFLDSKTQGKLSSSNHRTGSPTKRIGS